MHDIGQSREHNRGGARVHNRGRARSHNRGWAREHDRGRTITHNRGPERASEYLLLNQIKMHQIGPKKIQIQDIVTINWILILP